MTRVPNPLLDMLISSVPPPATRHDRLGPLASILLDYYHLLSLREYVTQEPHYAAQISSTKIFFPAERRFQNNGWISPVQDEQQKALSLKNGCVVFYRPPRQTYRRPIVFGKHPSQIKVHCLLNSSTRVHPAPHLLPGNPKEEGG